MAVCKSECGLNNYKQLKFACNQIKSTPKHQIIPLPPQPKVVFLISSATFKNIVYQDK
jgi:hypothetical protein